MNAYQRMSRLANGLCIARALHNYVPWIKTFCQDASSKIIEQSIEIQLSREVKIWLKICSKNIQEMTA